MALRVLGGRFRSRVLQAPAGRDTRPTGAMVREAVFNLLQGDCEDARVLDLFAGSGAMGLEALSRGAAHAVFCDRNRAAVQAIRHNIEALAVEAQAECLPLGWEQALKRLGSKGERFNLIFLDPPYALDAGPILFGLLYEQLLSARGIIVLEQGKDSASPVPESFDLFKERRYGSTLIRLLGLKEQAT